jgi:hypothetical protein
VQGRVKRRKEEKQDERETRPHGFVVMDLRSGIVVRGQDRAQGAGGEWNIFEHMTRNE